MAVKVLGALWLFLISPSLLFAQEHPTCPDDSYFTVTGKNGIRYGWHNDATCQFRPSSQPDHPACPDESYFTKALHKKTMIDRNSTVRIGF